MTQSHFRPSLAQNKSLKIRNSSTIQSKAGYESENETKSMNSTSSTLPFFPTRNTEANVTTSGTTKNSSRSLSQKGSQSTTNQKKLQSKALSLEET